MYIHILVSEIFFIFTLEIRQRQNMAKFVPGSNRGNDNLVSYYSY